MRTLIPVLLILALPACAPIQQQTLPSYQPPQDSCVIEVASRDDHFSQENKTIDYRSHVILHSLCDKTRYDVKINVVLLDEKDEPIVSETVCAAERIEPNEYKEVWVNVKKPAYRIPYAADGRIYHNAHRTFECSGK